MSLSIGSGTYTQEAITSFIHSFIQQVNECLSKLSKILGTDPDVGLAQLGRRDPVLVSSDRVEMCKHTLLIFDDECCEVKTEHS